jgi:hypothetical protein
MMGTHNIRFAEVQEQYLKTRDKKLLDQMYLICLKLAERYLKKYAYSHRLTLDIAGFAHDSAAYVIGMYLKKPGFRLEPLSGYLYCCCKSAMWRDKTWDKKTVSMEPLVEMELI